MGSVPEKAGTSTATRSGKVVGTLPWSSCCSQKWRRSFKDDGVEGSVVWWESESAESQQRWRPAMEMVFGEDGEARLGDRERAHGQQGQRGLPGWRQMDRWRGVRGLVQMAWTQVANPRKCSPTHLTSWGVHKFILACSQCVKWSWELDFIAFGVLGFVFTFLGSWPRSREDGPRRRDVGRLNNVGETLNGHFYLYGKFSKDQGSSDSRPWIPLA